MKKRNYSAEYYWRLERNPDYFKDYEKTRTSAFIGGRVKKTIAERLKEASKRRGVSQTEIIVSALKKELSDDLG